METTRRPAEDLIEVARVLLLVQGAILVATTIEALVWSFAFGGAAGMPLLLSGATAAAIFVARARVRPDRRRTRRVVYAVEGVILAILAIDTALAIALTGAYPPPMALLTRLLLPLSVVLLLRRSAHPSPATVSRSSVALEVVA
jgi:hypothetical protein